MQHRWHGHFSMLRNHVHPSTELQALFDRDGASTFKVEVLEHVPDPNWLHRTEASWIQRSSSALLVNVLHNQYRKDEAA